MNVDVRRLNQHLSEYLERAAAGERVVVTIRRVPKAVIVPVSGAGRLEQGIAEGWIRPARRDDGLAPVVRVSSQTRVLDILDLDRG